LNRFSDTVPDDSSLIPLPTHPNHEGFTHQIFFRYHPPKATIIAPISIISHHKVMTFRHLIFTCSKPYSWSNNNLMLFISKILYSKLVMAIIRVVILSFIVVRSDGFLQHGLTINVNNFIKIVDTITWQPHNSLNIINTGIFRIAKNHNIVLLWFTDINDFFINYR